MTEFEFFEIIKQNGGQAYLTGGAVRDIIRGVSPNDRDYVITGMTETQLMQLFPKAEKVGRGFPVYLIKIGDDRCEVSLARSERKVSKGYCGFDVKYTPDITIEEDLYRRDTTMNAIGYIVPKNSFIDPFKGIQDIQHRMIRAVSPHFKEDPVRALRVARQVAQLDFKVSDDTISLMEECAGELIDEPSERIVKETELALKTLHPSKYFQCLHKAKLLHVIYPEIADLIGQTQPVVFHPEGDAFEHTMKVIDEVAKHECNIETRFAALMHDIGKSKTPKSMLPHHYGHEFIGIEIFLRMQKRMKFPKRWCKSALFVIKEHMRANRLVRPMKIARLLLNIQSNPVGIDGFRTIIKADNNLKLADYLENAEIYIEEMKKINGSDAPENLTGASIGEWVFEKQVQTVKQQMER